MFTIDSITQATARYFTRGLKGHRVPIIDPSYKDGFGAKNTSVALRTSRDEDVRTAVTLGYVSLFDVDFSILYALPNALLEPRRGDTEKDRPTPNRSDY